MSIEIHPPLQPIHSSVLPKLDAQYREFHEKNNLHTPYIQDLKWSPSIRNAPTVPGGAAPLQVAKIEDIDVGNFKLRVFYPKISASTPLPVFIWYHGGGMVLGNINSENGFCTRVCNSAQCVVVSVDYRLAPEHPFPAGHDDAWEAFSYVYDRGESELGADVTRFGVGGSSSGGNLAAYVSQRAGLEGKKIDFVVLSVPVTDSTASSSSYKSWEENQHCPGLPAPKMLWYRDQYLPNKADRAKPAASPILATNDAFAKSPNRVHIAVAELDLLRSEGEAYAEQLRSSGKDVTLKVYPGVPHLIQAMDGVVDAGRLLARDLCREVAGNFGRHPQDVSIMDLYPDGFEVEVPQIAGSPVWHKLDNPMVLGEAPIYRASDKTLHYVDCLHDPAELHILQLDEKGDAVGQPRILSLSDSVTVQFFRENKPGYICAYFQGVAFMDEQTGELEVIKEIIPTEDREIRRFNDGGVDCQGRFWLAEIDRKALSYGPGKCPPEHGKPLGRLWRYDPDGSLHLMEDGLMCGNGLAWSPDNKTRLIFAYDFDIPTGALSNKRIFIDRREFGGEPDGMVCDVEGNLWIAMWGSYRVMVYDASGKHTKDIVFPAKRMACTAWGGPDYDTLYIVTATDNSPSRKEGDQGGHLFKHHVGIKGLPKYAFKG